MLRFLLRVILTGFLFLFLYVAPVLEKDVVPQISPVAEPLIVDTSEQDEWAK